jgi:hypothetical protein
MNRSERPPEWQTSPEPPVTVCARESVLVAARSGAALFVISSAREAQRRANNGTHSNELVTRRLKIRLAEKCHRFNDENEKQQKNFY